MRQKKSSFTIPGLLALLVVALMLPTAAGAATKYKALYRFKGGSDGAGPTGGLVFDLAGNLYGTTQFGGQSANCNGCGTAFKLTPNPDGSWTEKIIYNFCSSVNCADGAGPQASLIFDTAGNLYGTTRAINNIQKGVVFELIPNPDGSWTEKVLHTFTDSPDGSLPAGLIFDTAGNLYGTTENGGAGNGTVFKLTVNSDGSWTESLLYSFAGSHDGAFPVAGVIFDAAGNLYGTTAGGGASGYGSVFNLRPNSDGSWTKSTLYSFTGHKDGAMPLAGLAFDAAGSLYGTTVLGGSKDWGVIFTLVRNSNGWGEKVLHNFEDNPAANPQASMIFDATGNLYGTTGNNWNNAAGYGAVFELTPESGGLWGARILHAFQDKPAGNPFDSLVLDAAGILYGTAANCGGAYKCSGVVFEITP
jgi:uncharacterized repeat protein (TIGR03803 family)